MRIFTSFYAFAYAYSIVYISLRHLMAVSISKRFAASCCHCCKRRPGIMTKLLLAVPYGPRAERDTDWSEFKCSVPCARCATFWPCGTPGHANLPLSEATSANVTAVFPLAQAVDARCCFYRLYPMRQDQKDIKPTGLHMQVILNSALNLKSLDRQLGSLTDPTWSARSPPVRQIRQISRWFDDKAWF